LKFKWFDCLGCSQSNLGRQGHKVRQDGAKVLVHHQGFRVRWLPILVGGKKANRWRVGAWQRETIAKLVDGWLLLSWKGMLRCKNEANHVSVAAIVRYTLRRKTEDG
jgi:hypothetical protein